jgi:hypothetical protein
MSGLLPSNEKVLIHFDGANGATSAVDLYGNDVAFGGAAVLSTSGQKFGSACLSVPNAANDVVTITNTPDVALASAWTMELWARWPDLTTAADYFIFTAENAGFYGVNLELNVAAGPTKKLAVYLSSTGTTWNIANATLSSALTMSVDTNYHIAVTHDTGTGHYYVYFDGALVTDITSALNIGAITAIRIGNRGVDVGFGLKGKLDEFRLSNVCRYPGGTPFVPSASAFIA